MAARNVNQVYAQVKADITTTDNIMTDYREEVVHIQNDITRLNEFLDQEIESIFQEITPKIADWDEELAEEVKCQKDTNVNIQQQLTGLKKQKGALEQNIIATHTRSQIVEDAIGLDIEAEN